MATWEHGNMGARENGSMETRKHGSMGTWKHGDIKRKTEAYAIFFNPLTICSLWKLKFVVCPFVDEETNGSYPFANGLNGPAHLHMLTVLVFRHVSVSCHVSVSRSTRQCPLCVS
jgi:hypothetical protein